MAVHQFSVDARFMVHFLEKFTMSVTRIDYV